MQYDGFRSQRSWGSSWVLAVSIWLCFFLATPQMLHSQSSDSAPAASSPSTSTPLSQQAWQLVSRLEQRKLEVTSLQQNLDAADKASQTSDGSLAKAQALQAALATALMATSSSLALSLSESNASKASAAEYQALADQQIASEKAKADRYRYMAWAGFGAGIGGMAGGVSAGGTGAAIGAPAGALLGLGARWLGDLTKAW